MASSRRISHPHLRQPLPSPHPMRIPEPNVPPMHRPPPGNYPPFETFPPPEVMEQKLSAQRIEIQKLAVENQRLASTHGVLRQDLGAAKHELQLRHASAAEAMSDMDQQMRGLTEKASVIEAELKGAEPIRAELQKAHAEAKGLVDERQGLISKVQGMRNDLQRAHTEAMQIPALLSELDGLRQELHHCRATYDYEKRLFRDHLESLQVMEKNYVEMSREVEKLRAMLTNTSNIDPRTDAGVAYGGPSAYNESVAVGQYVPAPNAYGVGQHGHSSFTGGGADTAQANSPHIIAQTGPTNPHTAHNPARGSAQNAYLANGYDTYGRPIAGYDPQSVQTYNSQRYNNAQVGYGAYGAAAYDPQNAHLAYDMQRETTHDAQMVANYNAQKAAGYETSSRVSVAPPGQVSVGNVLPYGSGQYANRTGGSIPISGDHFPK